MTIDSEGLKGALQILGQLLADRGHAYEIIAIGGGSLLLLKLIERTTKDLDVVALLRNGELIEADPLPLPLWQAANDVGKALKLGQDWLNTGPASLLEGGLPKGFLNRVHTHYYKGLTVHLADRFDQICFKLYASVDQGPYSKHFADLIALKPTTEELEKAKNWCTTHDVSEAFALELHKTLEALHDSN